MVDNPSTAAARGAVACDSGEPAAAQTRACVAAWTAGEDALEHLAVLYAIEASQPEISRTKLEGLTEHYGYAAEGPAVEYFTLHERLDVEHARQAGELIAGAARRAPRRRGGGGQDARARAGGARGQLGAAGRRGIARGRRGVGAGAGRLAAAPAAMSRGRLRAQSPGEQDGGDGGREVEAGHARAHRDRDTGVGAREQLGAKPVALGPEREDRTRGQRGRVQLLAVGVEREQGAIERGRQPVGQAGDGQRVVQAGAPAQGVGMPGVVAAGGEHGGGVGGGGHAHAGAHVAEIARVLQQHHGRGTRVGERRGRVDRGALGDGDHPGRGRQRRELGEHVGRDLAREREHLRGHVGRQLSRRVAPARRRSAQSTSRTVAPKRRACLSGCSPSSTASDGSRRARP